MTYSIIIPHLNNWAKLQECLAALMALTQSRSDVEVIVVDNGSEKSIDAMSGKFPSVKWLLETSIKSPYPCRNTGIQAAIGEIIILLDSNCIPLPNFLAEGIKMFKEGADVVGGRLRLLHSGSRSSRFDVLHSAIDSLTFPIQALPGGVLFVKRRVFEQNDLFLPCVRSLGDIEWTGRAQRQGFNLKVTATAVANYQTKEWNQLVRKMIRLGNGKKAIAKQTGVEKSLGQQVGTLLKYITPPSPIFVNRLYRTNSKHKTRLSWPTVFLFCWLTKLLYAVGMLKGVEPRLCPPPTLAS